jgi:hypothetical protein
VPAARHQDDLTAIAVEAYVYLYPLVTMELTRRQLTSGEDPSAARGPMGRFNHARAFPDARFRSVVRPNFDTLYSTAWLDVGAEPLLISAPDSGGRYYLLPIMDMWTDVFAAPGTRTTGGSAIDVALTVPSWRGELPEKMLRIDAPTPVVWIIGRTKTDGPADYPAVHHFQDALAVTPLSSWGSGAPLVEAHTDPDLEENAETLSAVDGLSADEFFSLAAALMERHPPHLSDWSMVALLGRIGLTPGRPFDPEPGVRRTLGEVPAAAQALLASRMPRLANVVNGWQMNLDTMGAYGNSYVKRAIVTKVGLGAVPAEDSVYPLLVADADGAALDGGARYGIHFAADALPPVDAFWSVTMYDGRGFPVANELDRHALGDRDPLDYNADGSLDIWIGHDNPGPARVANWLPCPEGRLGVTMRLYAPRAPVLDGTWSPPPVRRIP